MAPERILERQAPDPGGKIVDLYPKVELVRVLVFKFSEELDQEEFRARIIRILAAIKANKDKRIRESSFPIWVGRTINSEKTELFTISLPEPLDHDIVSYFYNEFSSEEAYLECAAYLLKDAGGEPFARYVQGKVIVYCEPFLRPGDPIAEKYGLIPPCELRSWDIIREDEDEGIFIKPDPPKRVANFSALSDDPTERRHNLDLWQENKEIIFDFIWNLKHACGYRHLKDILMQYFGIGVFEESHGDFGRFGCIRLGWMRDADKSCHVRILIKSALDEKLKYVVLAHELAHYIRHFPLLLVGQLVEEQAWVLPEIEDYYHYLMITEYASLPREIEQDAFEVASFFLICPWMHPIKKVSLAVTERGEHPEVSELIWRFLQPCFPRDDGGRISWSDYDTIKRRACEQLLRVMHSHYGKEESIFESYYAASLRMEDRIFSGKLMHPEVEKATLEIYRKVLGLLAETMFMSTPDARNHMRSRLRMSVEKKKGIMDAEEYEHLLSGIDFRNRSFGREMVPPLAMIDKKESPRRVPLVPATHNIHGDIEGDWLFLEQLEKSPSMTLNEWRNHRPQFAFVLYRFESWQKEILEKTG